jgi:hypothetical protein
MPLSLSERRLKAAEHEYETYDYGAWVVAHEYDFGVSDQMQVWSTGTDGRQVTRVFYMRDPEQPSDDDHPDSSPVQAKFTVVFADDGSDTVVGAYASYDDDEFERGIGFGRRINHLTGPTSLPPALVIFMNVAFAISGEKALANFVSGSGNRSASARMSDVIKSLVNPQEDPASVGYIFNAWGVDGPKAGGEQNLHVRIEAVINDVPAFVDEAIRQHKIAWPDLKHWFPLTAEEALFELLVAPNTGTSPVRTDFMDTWITTSTTNNLSRLTYQNLTGDPLMLSDGWFVPHGNLIFKDFPPRNVEQAFYDGDLDTVSIRYGGKGVYWLTDSRDGSHIHCDSLAEAKKSAEVLISEAKHSASESVRRDAGLDDAWTYRIEKNDFLRKDDESIRLFTNDLKDILMVGAGINTILRRFDEADEVLTSPTPS